MSIASAQSLGGSMNQRSGTNGQIFVGNIAGPPGPPGAPGSPGPQGPKGDTYVLTDTDMLVIADIVLHSGLLDDTPVFDLTDHMAPIPLTGISIGTARMDTTEIRAALDKGPVAFVIPFSVEGTTLNAKIIMNTAGVNGEYQSVILVDYFAPSVLTVTVNTNGISTRYTPINDFVKVDTPSTPVFNLADMGMEAVAVEGGHAVLETDTTEIRAALDKGAVTFGIPVSMNGSTFTAYFTMTGFTDGGSMYQCTATVLTDDLGLVLVSVEETVVAVAATPMKSIVGGSSSPVSIDLSKLETLGTIVETFADGSVAITFLEFDSEGRPTKITDRNGDVTVLTW